MAILRRWQFINAAYSGNPDSMAYSLTGRKWYVAASGVVEMTSRAIKEMLADCSPVVQKSSIGPFKTVPVIVAYGNFALDPTNNGDGTVPFYDLTALVNTMYQTATPAISYFTAVNLQGLPGYIDVTDVSLANFSGPKIPVAEQAITDAFGVLQGNLDCGDRKSVV